MSYSTLVSNATGKRFNLPIRLTDAKGNQYYRDVKILPYALNQTLIFDSEEQYKKWVNEYSEYVSGKESIIKLEKTSGHALEKQNKKLEKEFSDKNLHSSMVRLEIISPLKLIIGKSSIYIPVWLD